MENFLLLQGRFVYVSVLVHFYNWFAATMFCLVWSCVISGWLFGKSVVQHKQVAVWCHKAVHTTWTQLSREARLLLHLFGSSTLSHWLLLAENQQVHAQVKRTTKVSDTWKDNSDNYMTVWYMESEEVWNSYAMIFSNYLDYIVSLYNFYIRAWSKLAHLF